jgi:hypothetical protein
MIITQWLTFGQVATVGTITYLVAFFASLAIAWRMWSIWKRWGVEMAGALMGLSLLAAAYWLYVITLIHLGCQTGAPSIDDWICSEVAFWSRILVAIGTSAIAWWAWKMK